LHGVPRGYRNGTRSRLWGGTDIENASQASGGLMSESRAVKELSPEHAGAVRQLAADWDTATRLGLEGASPETVNEYIAARARAHKEGRGHTFVVTEGNDVAAICGLTGLDTDTPSMFVAVASSMRGRGIASFTIKQMLELAFGELQ